METEPRQPALPGALRSRNEGPYLAGGIGCDSCHLPPPSRETLAQCCPFCFLPHSLAWILESGCKVSPDSPLLLPHCFSSSSLGCWSLDFLLSTLRSLGFCVILELLFPFFHPLPSPSYFLSVLWAFPDVSIRMLLCSSQAVRSHTRTECKCHGLSGSCALRTCWQKLPPFREVGARLLERFHGASRVMGTNDGKALLPAVRTLKPPGRADLLYAADSPDFCAPNRRTGSPGTRGRACNSSAPDLSGCDLLCCGRGHRQESVQLEENCLCRFHWCCVVQCHRCRVRKELSLCL